MSKRKKPVSTKVSKAAKKLVRDGFTWDPSGKAVGELKETCALLEARCAQLERTILVIYHELRKNNIHIDFTPVQPRGPAAPVVGNIWKTDVTCRQRPPVIPADLGVPVAAAPCDDLKEPRPESIPATPPSEVPDLDFQGMMSAEKARKATPATR